MWPRWSGLQRLREFPLSLRLIREVHALLMEDRGRGARLMPGEFRRSQVWIGGTRPGNAVFVPPPANELDACLKHFERFLHDEPEATPPLVKAALAHVQFETIHPFLDGNGRLGRLLIALQLAAEGLMREPLLYLSLHFKRLKADLLRSTGMRSVCRAIGRPGWSSSPTRSWRARRKPPRRQSGFSSWPRRMVVASKASAVQQLRPGDSSCAAIQAHGYGSVARSGDRPHASDGEQVAGPPGTDRRGSQAFRSKQRGRVFSYLRYVEILNEGMELPAGVVFLESGCISRARA